jgi:hypothetical protein
MTTATKTITVKRARTLLAKANRPFSGSLIAPPGDAGKAECEFCAQGIILHALGMSDDDLRSMLQTRADAEVAKAIGISRVESVLLRKVNDSGPGLPQAVLDLSDAGIGSVIGGEWRLLVSFWRHLGTLGEADWISACTAAGNAACTAAGNAACTAACTAAGNAACTAACTASWNAAWDAACTAACTASWNAAWDAAYTAAWNAAGASSEIQGRSKLKAFYFLPFFGFKTPENISLHPAVK